MSIKATPIKIEKIEHIIVDEPENVFDISVESDNHNFSLYSSGISILVHNCLGVPKQLFGYTGDSAGFDAGKSLSIISASYASGVAQIQTTICQMITDMINILLIDRGLDGYVGKFRIQMVTPKTDEDEVEEQRTHGKLSTAQDVMNLVGNALDEPTIPKLKILKAMLSPALTNQDVLTVIQDEIDRLEKEQSEQGQEETDLSEGGITEGDFDMGHGFGGGFEENGFGEPSGFEGGFGEEGGFGGGTDLASAINGGNAEEESFETEPLPTPAELNIGDLTNPEM